MHDNIDVIVIQQLDKKKIVLIEPGFKEKLYFTCNWLITSCWFLCTAVKQDYGILYYFTSH